MFISFAKRAGAVPQDATKKSHEVERGVYKQAVLGIQYGMEVAGLALRIGKPEFTARMILEAHRRTYPMYWSWSDRMVAQALFTGKIGTGRSAGRCTSTVMSTRVHSPTSRSRATVRR